MSNRAIRLCFQNFSSLDEGKRVVDTKDGQSVSNVRKTRLRSRFVKSQEAAFRILFLQVLEVLGVCSRVLEEAAPNSSDNMGKASLRASV